MGDDFVKGRPIHQDPGAESADAALPPFLARPQGAPVYHGFAVLSDVVVDGFTLGEITPFENAEAGDAFVIAPDDSRAGLVWELGADYEVEGTSHDDGSGRWGVFNVVFARAFASHHDFVANLAGITPRLREEWERYRSGQAPPVRG
jgi:hypothetical protein